MPINAMGLEWFSIVLLLSGNRKNEEIDSERVAKTFIRLKNCFLSVSIVILLIWVARIALHWWTASLGVLANLPIDSYYCEFE